MCAQAPVKKTSALHPKPENAPVFKGVTWSATNGQWRAQAWDGKRVGPATTLKCCHHVVASPKITPLLRHLYVIKWASMSD